MRFFLGCLVGVVLIFAIAAGAIWFAFGSLSNFDTQFHARDRANDIVRSYDLAEFDAIDVAGVYEVDVSVGGTEWRVELRGPADEFERADIRVVDGVLILDREDGFRRISWRSQHSMTATIAMPALIGLDASGVVNARASGVSAEAFRASVSGVGKVEISGECGSLAARVSGVGSLDAEDFVCRRVDATLSGIGKAAVHATEEVDASVSGIGSIEVYGSPAQVRQHGGPLANVRVR
jgi:hypothetical protein